MPYFEKVLGKNLLGKISQNPVKSLSKQLISSHLKLFAPYTGSKVTQEHFTFSSSDSRYISVSLI